MSWLLSIRHRECDPTTATGGANPPYRIINKSGLDSIISELKERGAMADDQSCSIPKPTASIEYMRARIAEIDEHTDIADAAHIDAAVNAWIGTLAVIILSGRKNLSIIEKDILVSSANNDGNDRISYLKKAIFDDFNALGFLEENAAGSYLKLFSINKQTKSYPLAIADKTGLIFSPINNVDPAVAISLGDFMRIENRRELNSGVETTYQECVWKHISEWTNFSEDDRLYLSSWIDGMLKSIGDMKCKKALKALNRYLKASVLEYINSVVDFAANPTNNSNNVLRWKSAWSYIALSKLFGDDLEIEPVDTKSITTSPGVSRWLSTTFNTDSNTASFMHIVVKHKGNPVVKFYPEVGLYLYNEIPNPQVWYNNGSWIDPFQANAQIVCPDFKSDLMWYLERVCGSFAPHTDTARALNNWINSARDSIAPTDAAALQKIGLLANDLFDAQVIASPSVQNALGLIVSNNNTYVDLFNQVLTLGLPEVFNPNLVVFYDDKDEIAESETISFKINDAASHIKAFWPIKPEMAKYVVEHKATLVFNDVVGCLDNKTDN